jgi:hypothetical protein
LELSFDTDRDYVTSFTLAVDADGRTRDTCGRDTAWSPQWFLAARKEARAWTIEAAIPLSELSRSAPQAGAIWALAVRRMQPGVGIRCATGDASPKPGPGSFGWLEWK